MWTLLHSEVEREQILMSNGPGYGTANMFLFVEDGKDGKVAHINIVPNPNGNDVPSTIHSTQTAKATLDNLSQPPACKHTVNGDSPPQVVDVPFVQLPLSIPVPVDPKNPNHLQGHQDILEPPGSGAKAYHDWDLTLDSYPKVH